MLLERIGPSRFLLADDRMLDWVAARIPGIDANRWRGMARALGVVINGAVVAGMVVSAWDRRAGNVEISFAADSPKWATRDTIARLMAYPFVQLDCRRVTTFTAASNRRALRFNEGLGFKREGLIRRGFSADEDAVICGLLRDEAPAWMVPQPPLATTAELG